MLILLLVLAAVAVSITVRWLVRDGLGVTTPPRSHPHETLGGSGLTPVERMGR